MARPFNPFTFLIDQEIDRHLGQMLVALNAIAPALAAAREAGDAVHFERLAGHFVRYRREALALDPAAPVPQVSLDFRVPAPLAAAA